MLKNNYFLAIICIVLIVLITLISINSNLPSDNSAGQAYGSVIEKDDVIKVEKTSTMTKTYVKSEPERYAYLREK